jgi:3-methyladenine DNA glycosylase AlkD
MTATRTSARKPMKPRRPSSTAKSGARAKPPGVPAILAELRRHGSAKDREGMARYGIVAPKAFGVRMATMQQLAKRIGRNHELAQKLWAAEWYEARTLAAFIDDPAQVTPAQMDRWARDFDNWAICDGVCFHLFDRTPHAFAKIAKWATHRDEFVKRAAFALLASVALHDKQAPDARFVRCLPLIERAATDERNFVKKGVSWALRGVGRRPGVKKAAIALATKLAASTNPAARWIGKDALRDLRKAR